MSAAPESDSAPKLFGVLCTYRRSSDALVYLDLLELQTQRPDVVLVVDNSSDERLAASIEARSDDAIECHYIDAGENLGPAGAFRLGFETLVPLATNNDLVVFFDDDDPPGGKHLLSSLTAALIEERFIDTSVGGIGLSGGILNRRTGLVSPSALTVPYAGVDHLHGGYLPTYSFGALASVRCFDPTFFFGFEELELGRRLHAKGFKLLVHTALMSEIIDRYPKKKASTGPRASRGNVPDVGWGRFYKERNLIRVLRREHLWSALAFTVTLRQILRPALSLPSHPSTAWHRLVIGVRATVAGLRGDSGIDPRYPPA